MRRSFSIAVVTFGSLVTACGGSANPDSSAAITSAVRSRKGVYGTARDPAGVALAGVRITDGDHAVDTASDGSYLLAESSGTYTLTASRQGYVTASQSVTVPNHGGVQVDWALSPAATQPPVSGAYKVFANNDLGMHCVDSSFAVFSILPPYNVVDAQVVQLRSSGNPVLLDATQVGVRYSAIADATGSINSTSIGKSNFWQYGGQLYGAALQPGEGLQGMWMPADSPDLAGTTLSWDAELGLFKAPGIPIFPTDDAGHVNPYPLMRFSAYDAAGNTLGSTDVVLPVSDETSCRNCHATSPSDTEDQVRQRILDTHNAKLGTSLSAPVLCASCHYSPVLDLAGSGPSTEQTRHATMSRVVHGFHANKVGRYDDEPVGSGSGFLASPPPATSQSCYACHPGAQTQCLRGAMTSSLDCQNCHGNVAAVAGADSNRTPWLDEPKCQSCHAGDAVDRTASDQPLAADGIRFTLAYSPTDATATPKLATNKRFAENDGKLYRKSKGHGGLACEACHGSTHALWSGNSNDNVAAMQMQGHAGTIAECDTCHLAPPPNGLDGPHGMHPIGAAWVTGHESIAQANRAQCQACHGTDYRGTVLSRTFATRTLAGKSFATGTEVGCYDCHNGPGGE